MLELPALSSDEVYGDLGEGDAHDTDEEEEEDECCSTCSADDHVIGNPTATTASANVQGNNYSPSHVRLRLNQEAGLKQVREVFDVAEGQNWHTVCALDDAGYYSKNKVPGGSQLRPVPPRATAILVLSDARCYEQAGEVISEMIGAMGQYLPPVIALLLPRSPSDFAGDEREILQAQAYLQEAGADDVVLKGDGPASLLCTVAMSISRAKRQIQQEEGLRAYAGRVQELHENMWKTVLRLKPEFPGIEGTRCAVRPGAHVGKCTLVKKIGSGGTSDAYVAWNQEQGRYEAVKVIQKECIRSVERALAVWAEVKVLSRLQSKHTPTLYSFTHTPNLLSIHMSFAGTQHLCKAIEDAGGRFTVESSRIVAAQVGQALAYCHGQGTAHGDVKPENIVLVRGEAWHVQLIDFGSAMPMGTTTYKGYRGTMPFMAPEILSGSGYEPAPTDVWSTGVVMLEVLCGAHKLNRMMRWRLKGLNPDRRLYEDLVQFFDRPGALTESLQADGVDLSPDLLSMMQGTLELLPTSRWTAVQLLESQFLSAAVGAW
jgi:hypothetical protein